MFPSARRLALALLLVAGGVAAAGWGWGRGVAGAGALHQYAPANVQPGAPFEIKVLAGVWGEGREASVRYRDWSLQLQQGGQPVGPPAKPARIEREGDRVALFFELRAPVSPTEPGASLTWQLRFTFDGRTHQVPGPHPIEVAR